MTWSTNSHLLLSCGDLMNQENDRIGTLKIS